MNELIVKDSLRTQAICLFQTGLFLDDRIERIAQEAILHLSKQVNHTMENVCVI